MIKKLVFSFGLGLVILFMYTQQKVGLSDFSNELIWGAFVSIGIYTGYQGIKKERRPFEVIPVLLFVVLSPLVFNRLEAHQIGDCRRKG